MISILIILMGLFFIFTPVLFTVALASVVIIAFSLIKIAIVLGAVWLFIVFMPGLLVVATLSIVAIAMVAIFLPLCMPLIFVGFVLYAILSIVRKPQKPRIIDIN